MSEHYSEDERYTGRVALEMLHFDDIVLGCSFYLGLYLDSYTSILVDGMLLDCSTSQQREEHHPENDSSVQ